MDSIGTCDIELPYVEEFTAFSSFNLKVDGVEIFGGRIGSPTYRYATDGTRTEIKAYDYTIKLMDYLTPFASYTDTSTGTLATSILTNTPFTASVDGTFGYDSPLILIDTWIEMMMEIETYSDTTVELNIINGPEVEDEIDGTDDYTGCPAGLKQCFYYDGITQRIYVFWKNAAGDLVYFHSQDGATWTEVDTGYNPSGNSWSVSWYDDKVYLFVYNGANTDFYRGTINDGTGTITFGVTTGNIFANEIKFGPVWDDQGDMWVIRNSGGGLAYESTDDGATWNNRFGPGANELWGLAQVGSDGDMMGIAFDSANTDLEEWLWDRSAGTFTYVRLIDGVDDVDGLDVCQDADLNVYVAWFESDESLTIISSNISGSWLEDDLEDTFESSNISVGSTGYRCYVIYACDAGTYIKKYYGNTMDSEYVSGTIATTNYVNCPRGYLQDGRVGIFFTATDTPVNNDPYSLVFPPEGITLVEGASAGYFVTDAITASGSAVRWGRMVATGTAEEDTEWSVLDASDDSVIASGQPPYFDLTVAGVSITTTSIKLRADFTYDTTDIYITQVILTEMIDALSLDVDYDNTYTGFDMWRKLSGGEFYMDSDDVVHLVDERGTDRSSYVVLKNTISDDYPDVVPNIKVVEVYTDWDSYANSVRVLGDGEPPLRAEGILVDASEVALRGEHWATLRDPDLVADAMAYTRAMDFLAKNSQVIQRVSVDFIDPTVAGGLGIGDYVTLAVRYKSINSSDIVIDSSARIINLSRGYDAGGGSTVSADLITVVKNRIFYNYLKSVNDQLRWITA